MTTKKTVILFVSAIFLLPFSASATVIINEIAWMGTAESTGNEWIELYNSGNESVSVTDWSIATSDGKLHGMLSGTIGAGGYYLLERTDDSTLPGVTADAFYVGAMSNEGETLALKDNSGNVVDTVEGSRGWSAGDNETKDTMQKVAGAWATGIPTPKSQNSANATPGGSGNSGTQNSGSSSSSASEPLSNTSKSSSGDLKISFSADSVLIPAGSGTYFRAEATRGGKDADERTSFIWSFGDGTGASAKEVWHSFRHAGTYIVTLKAVSGEEKAGGRLNVSVFDPNIALAFENIDGVPALVVTNNSSSEINLTHFGIRIQGRGFTFPDDTILDGNAKIMLGTGEIGFPLAPLFAEGATPELIFPSGKITAFHAAPAPTASVLHSMNQTLAQKLVEAETLNQKIAEISPLPVKENVVVVAAVPQLQESQEVSAISPPEKIVIVEKPKNIFTRIWDWLFGD